MGDRARVFGKSEEGSTRALHLETDDGEVRLVVPRAVWDQARVHGYVSLPDGDWGHPEAGLRLKIEF